VASNAVAFIATARRRIAYTQRKAIDLAMDFFSSFIDLTLSSLAAE
jgi:hypothetical protein